MTNPHGRPKKPPEESLVERIDLRLTTAERLEYEQAAQHDGKSLSAWIRTCLSKAAKRGAKVR
jgi:uncharacterized protein (DUF1778 family)